MTAEHEPIPPELEYTRVDVVVECFSIRPETERELLLLAEEHMPGGAYGGVPPGEDDWPEPDRSADRPYALACIWEFLSEEARRDVCNGRNIIGDATRGGE